MKPMLIVYATRWGEAEWVAEHLAESLLRHGVFVELGNAAHLADDFDLASGYGSVILAASVHGRRHEREIVRFVKRHRAVLERIPTAFLSVSPSQAAAESTGNSPEKRQRAASKLEAALEKFQEECGWTVRWALAVAGALPYRRFRRPRQWVMRLVARANARPDDALQDDAWTDWTALDRLADAFAMKLRKAEGWPLAATAHV